MILVDVNVFLDVFMGRSGVESSARVIDRVRAEGLTGAISALTVPIIWFLLEKWKSNSVAKNEIREIIKGFEILPLDTKILNNALESELPDFEDAIQFYSALRGKCRVIVTRNKKDFPKRDGIRILTPEEFLEAH